MFELFILFCIAIVAVTGVDKSKIKEFKDNSSKFK